MRVLYYHQHFSTPSGAIGTRSYEMAKKLLEKGHEVTMVCGSFGLGDSGLRSEYRRGRREGIVDGIRVIEFHLPYDNKQGLVARSVTFLRYALRSVRVSLTEQYDLVIATSTPLTAAIPGIAAKVLRRKPFVFEVRDLWPELPRAMGVISNPLTLQLLNGLEWQAYRSATLCIGLSPGIVSGIRRRAGENKRIRMIPNGCDLRLFNPSREPDSTFPGAQKSDFVAVFTGAHGPANGLEAVLDAARELQRRNRSDISLVLIGDGKCKAELRATASVEGLNQVMFLDPVPKTELVRLLNLADAGLMLLADVSAFYYGTSPNKFFDYIAMGLPVLNNYPGWLADMIDEHQLGLVIPPGDAVKFADALESLADGVEDRASMGRNARLLAESRFSRAQLSTAFVEEIEAAASQ